MNVRLLRLCVPVQKFGHKADIRHWPMAGLDVLMYCLHITSHIIPGWLPPHAVNVEWCHLRPYLPTKKFHNLKYTTVIAIPPSHACLSVPLYMFGLAAHVIATLP